MRSVGCVEALISAPAYHANNPPHVRVLRARLYLRAKLYVNLLPYWIFVWPEALRRCLVDEHHRFAFLVVGVGKKSTCDERRGEDMEKLGRWHTQLSGRSFTCCGNAADELKASGVAQTGKGSVSTPDCDFLHAGHCADATQHFTHENITFFLRRIGIVLGVIRYWQPQPCGHHVVGVEAGLYLEHFPEAAQQKACAHHQHERERELASNQRVKKAVLTRGEARATGPLTQFVHQSPVGHLQCRSQAEEDASDYGNRRGEEKRSPVQSYFRESGKIRWNQREQNVLEPKTQGKGEHSAANREDDAFGQGLADQSPATCSERLPHGDFTVTRGRSRQQQAGDVHAGNQQHNSHRGQEQK